jgi:hypothetical protein
MIQKTDLFGNTSIETKDLKTRVYRILDQDQSLAHHSKLTTVVKMIAAEIDYGVLNIEGKTIAMQNVTLDWVIKNSPQVERLIRMYNQDNR